MSVHALDLLIKFQLLRSSGKAESLTKIPSEELSLRLTGYINARKNFINDEISRIVSDSTLNAQYSTWSSSISRKKILSSLLVYDKVILDDPLVITDDGMTYLSLVEKLEFISWLFPLVRAGFVSFYPINSFNKPSGSIPFLSSDDAFKSSIPAGIHDYIHNNVILKSAIKDSETDSFYILKEDAAVNKRTAINVGFKNDFLSSGVSLFLHKTIQPESVKRDGDNLILTQCWDPDGTLDQNSFDIWSYQVVNQAILARLKSIYDQTYLASLLGYTYVTESQFESKLLSLAGIEQSDTVSPCAKFLELNDTFIQIDSPSVILKLRDKYNNTFNTFNTFNRSLLCISEELTSVHEGDFEKRATNLFHREIMPQVDELRDGIGTINSGLVKGALASFGGAAFAIVTGTALPIIPSLMLGVAGGLTEAYPAIAANQRVKKKPAYIWHRIVKKHNK
ncbi:TPA: hypothetical protein ACX6QX_001452 [Photobacterium damselae]